MLGDKDVDGVAEELSKIAAKVFVTSPASPRAAPAGRLAEAMSRYGPVDGEFGTVAEAMDAAMEAREDMNVLVTGSFRTAEDALRWLQARYARS